MKSLAQLRNVLMAAVSMVTVAALSLPAHGADGNAPAEYPKAESVLTHIPAGAMAFVVVNNLKDAAGEVDAFLTDVGLSAVTGPAMPQGALRAMLDGLKADEGYNPNAGLAAVLLDPNAMGVNLVALAVKQMQGQAASAPASAEASAKPQLPPLVVLIGGTDPLKLVKGMAGTPDGENIKYAKDNGDPELFARRIGGYVAISPSPAALDAVAKAPKMISQELTKSQIEYLSRASLAIQIDMKVANPVIVKAVKALEIMAAAKENGLVGDNAGGAGLKAFSEFHKIIPMYLQMLADMERMTLALRTVKTGVIFEGQFDCLPNSDMAKAIAAMKAPATNPLDCLPNESYAIAAGAVLGSDWAAQALRMRQLDQAFEVPPYSKLDANDKKDAKQLIGEFGTQVTSFQFVVGGVAEDVPGLLNITAVLKCKDTAKVKDALARAAALGEQILHNQLGEAAKDVKLEYAKGAAKSGQKDADAVTLTLNEEFAAKARPVFLNLLGEEQVRLLIAAPDDKSVVLSLGGGEKALAEAVKASDGTGTLSADAGIAEVMKLMPPHPIILETINMANIFDLIMKGSAKMNGGQTPPVPFQFVCKVPITVGGAAEGNSQTFIIYLPTGVVKDFANIFTMFRAMRPQSHRTKPTPNGQDF